MLKKILVICFFSVILNFPRPSLALKPCPFKTKSKPCTYSLGVDRSNSESWSRKAERGFVNILDAGLHEYALSGSVAMNANLEWVACIEGSFHMGKGNEGKKLFSLNYQRVYAASVDMDNEGRWVAVLGNDLYSGFRGSYRKLGHTLTSGLNHAAACSISPCGDFIAIMDDDIWIGKGESAARIHDAEIGEANSAAAVSLNVKGNWIAVIDDQLFLGNGNEFEKLIDLENSKCIRGVSCSINDSGEWVAVIDKSVFHGFDDRFSKVADFDVPSDIRCSSVALDCNGKWIIVLNDDIYSGMKESLSGKIFDCKMKEIESSCIAMNDQGCWVATVDDNVIAGSGNQAVQIFDGMLGSYAKATGAAISSNTMLVLIDDKVFMGESRELLCIRKFQQIHREEL